MRLHCITQNFVVPNYDIKFIQKLYSFIAFLLKSEEGEKVKRKILQVTLHFKNWETGLLKCVGGNI